jgi:hypothetical protein
VLILGFGSFLIFIALLAGAVLFVIPSLGLGRKVAALYGFGACMGGLLGALAAELTLPIIQWEIRAIADGMASLGLRRLAREVGEFGSQGGGVFVAMAFGMALALMVIWCFRRFSRQLNERKPS